MTEVEFYKDLKNYTVEHFDRENTEALSWLASYGSKSDNYSMYKLRFLIDSNRLTLGIFVIKHHDIPVAIFGVDEFRGWAVITRFLRLAKTNTMIPFMFGVGIPFLLKHLGNKVQGICSTENNRKSSLVEALQKRFIDHKDVDGIFYEASQTAKQIRKLPCDVMYRDVRQTAFTYHTTLQPPFRNYEPSL